MQSMLYLLDKDTKYGDAAGPMDALQLGSHVNPDLGNTSEYFGKLEAMMQCVEKNADLAKPGNEEL